MDALASTKKKREVDMLGSSQDWSSIRRSAFELVVGFVLCIFVVALLFYEIVIMESTCGERSSVEMIQFLLLLSSSLTFFNLAVSRADLSGGLFLIGAFVLCMAIRELDWITDRIPYLSWAHLVTLVLIAALWIAYRNKETVVHGLAVFSESRASVWMIIGLLCVLVFSRLFGSKHIWYNLWDADRVRVLKNVVEEGLELFGYALMMTASILFRNESRRTLRIQSTARPTSKK